MRTIKMIEAITNNPEREYRNEEGKVVENKHGAIKWITGQTLKLTEKVMAHTWSLGTVKQTAAELEEEKRQADAAEARMKKELGLD